MPTGVLARHGASGAGKSTVRELVARDLAPEIECVELRDVVRVSAFPTLEWRQRATEATVLCAPELQAGGRHLLLSGDPVAAGEVLAAPSAGKLDTGERPTRQPVLRVSRV
jgi:hypothetical protein